MSLPVAERLRKIASLVRELDVEYQKQILNKLKTLKKMQEYSNGGMGKGQS